ncbi:MAG: hypothetical protein K9W46_04615 [Candidatus Heimdallarchaeum endolithica]|uniref:Uncharacterized protein n=1 Tax=Candidatus Heimdallarchaeum endolithica TaxID=2876572 RepID=A0A9Y1BT54_9ARCH|nr:MAG: hypothetical protein K9W46_04615 [Candidatus Heimdallarchaeum endolithica]
MGCELIYENDDIFLNPGRTSYLIRFINGNEEKKSILSKEWIGFIAHKESEQKTEKDFQQGFYYIKEETQFCDEEESILMSDKEDDELEEEYTLFTDENEQKREDQNNYEFLSITVPEREYTIDNISPKDNIADLIHGFRLRIPEYSSYDLLLGLTYQGSGDLTLRICKYNFYNQMILPKDNIDFIKSDKKLHYIHDFAEGLEKIIDNFATLNKIKQNKERKVLNSSLRTGTSCYLVYSLCYYKDNRHIGIAFYPIDNKTIFRIFRVDLPYSAQYEVNIRTDHYGGHKCIDISIQGLNYKKFIISFKELFMKILEYLDETDTLFIL